MGKSKFSEQFRKLINRYKRKGYNLDIMRQAACLVVNSITVDRDAFLFKFSAAVRPLHKAFTRKLGLDAMYFG